jgi:hypothetical protein
MGKARMLVTARAERPDGTEVVAFQGCEYEVTVNGHGNAWATIPGITGGTLELSPGDYEILESGKWGAPIVDVETSWSDFQRRVLLVPFSHYGETDMRLTFYAGALQVALLLQGCPEAELAANVEKIRVECSGLIENMRQ